MKRGRFLTQLFGPTPVMLLTLAVVTVIWLLDASITLGDTFGSGSNTFDIEFVTVGDPGNSGDPIGFPPGSGTVNHAYRIGKFEISEGIIDKANAITQAEGNPLDITHDGRGADKPATSVSWFEAARFINWLNTSTNNTPAYKFDDEGNMQLWTADDAGYDPNNLFRNRHARYFLPSVDEWHKAAYYDPDSGGYFLYPTGSNLPPVPVADGTRAGSAVFLQIGPADTTLAGGLSPYGTMAQGGNAREWVENVFGLPNTSPLLPRLRKGAAWFNDDGSLLPGSAFRTSPFEELNATGFRVASVPEPTSLGLFMLAAVTTLLIRWRVCCC